MRRTKIIIFSLLMSIAVAAGATTVLEAKWSDNLQSGDRVAVAADEVRQGSLYASGDRIVVEGTVEGDLYCAGRELVLSGEVTGDVLCAVQTAVFDGNVGQDIRLAGQYATINGEVGGSVTFFGQDIKVQGEGSVGGDVNGAAQFVTLAGPVGRSVFIGSQKLTLNSTVGGNVDVAVDQMDVASDARVAGDFNYSATREASIGESVVGGSVHFNPAERGDRSAGLAGMLMFLISLAACALIIALLVPRFVERSRRIASESAITVGLTGFAVFFGGPIVVLFLMVSVVLMPLGLLVLALWFAALIASQALFAYLLGSLFLRQQNNVVIRALAGVVVLAALYLIPFINILAMFASVVYGMGMVFSTALNGYRRPSYTLEDSVPEKSRKK